MDKLASILGGLSLPVRTKADRYTAFTLSDDSTLIVATPPERAHNSDYAREKAADALEALDYLEAARRTVNADKSLSEIGRAEKLKDLRQQTARIVERTQAEMAAHAATLETWAGKVFSPAVIDRTDAVTVAEDVEIRTMLRGMGATERTALLENIVSQPRMMEAVLRAPVPIPVVTDAIRRSWREHVEATHPDAPNVATGRAAVEWASQVLGQIGAAVGAGPQSSPEKALAEQGQN